MSQALRMPAANSAIKAAAMRSGAQGARISRATAETVVARYPRTGILWSAVGLVGLFWLRQLDVRKSYDGDT
jgi:hypothetical protein